MMCVMCCVPCHAVPHEAASHAVRHVLCFVPYCVRYAVPCMGTVLCILCRGMDRFVSHAPCCVTIVSTEMFSYENGDWPSGKKWCLGPPWCQYLNPCSAILRENIVPSRFAAVSRRVRMWSVKILLRRLCRCSDVVATTKNWFFVSRRTYNTTFRLFLSEFSSENISRLIVLCTAVCCAV